MLFADAVCLCYMLNNSNLAFVFAFFHDNVAAIRCIQEPIARRILVYIYYSLSICTMTTITCLIPRMTTPPP